MDLDRLHQLVEEVIDCYFRENPEKSRLPYSLLSELSIEKGFTLEECRKILYTPNVLFGKKYKKKFGNTDWEIACPGRSIPRKSYNQGPFKGYIYVLYSLHGSKIGKTKDLKYRTNLIGTQLPFKVELKFSFPVDDIDHFELLLHRHFKEKRLNGEWFDLSEEELNSIADLIKADLPPVSEE